MEHTHEQSTEADRCLHIHFRISRHCHLRYIGGHGNTSRGCAGL
jgi:hypothetical protein